MGPDEILQVIRAQPFEPFRLCLTDGAHYDIPHPEFCWVTRHAIFVGIFSNADDLVPERSIKVDPLHIVRLKPLSSKTPPSNGQ